MNKSGENKMTKYFVVLFCLLCTGLQCAAEELFTSPLISFCSELKDNPEQALLKNNINPNIKPQGAILFTDIMANGYDSKKLFGALKLGAVGIRYYYGFGAFSKLNQAYIIQFFSIDFVLIEKEYHLSKVQQINIDEFGSISSYKGYMHNADSLK